MSEGKDTLSSASPPRRGRRHWASRLALVGAVTVVAGVASIGLAMGLGAEGALLLALLFALGFLFMWGAVRLLRRLLWRVGRRLAFTYFLIGVLPIPMVAFLIAVGAYLLSGFFLGHLFRDALAVVYREVASAAVTRLEQPGSFVSAPRVVSDVAFAYYFDGRRVGGDDRAPEEWPLWLEKTSHEIAAAVDRRDTTPPLVALRDGTLSIAAAASRGSFGVVGFFDGHLETRLREVSQVWIDLVRHEEVSDENTIDVTILGERFVFQPLSRERGAEDRRQFLNRGSEESTLWVHGFDVAGRLVNLDDGSLVAPGVPASLIGTPGVILGQLVSAAREVDTVAWLTFVVPAFLLFDIFAVAWIMAVFMIFGLSRAVNRLSTATSALQQGDFSVRIPVRRRDQVGDLQASFNQMAASLEDLIATKAQKESLDKELEIARELQKSLIPNEVVQLEEVEFATYFEPSAAIGGDYFDIIRLDPRRLAVVIADVSGHGLSAGLRMAMLKAALGILIVEEEEDRVVLERLDEIVRSSDDGGSFVTATLARVDLVAGRLELVNAGHPPTYLLRDGEVEEIVLPSAPLGALSDAYGATSFGLRPGDALVWLSDGFIEATDEDGELFGYERTLEALRGETETASAVRDRLLEKIGRYTHSRPAEDDRTMVVMRYRARGQTALPRRRMTAAG